MRDAAGAGRLCAARRRAGGHRGRTPARHRSRPPPGLVGAQLRRPGRRRCDHAAVVRRSDPQGDPRPLRPRQLRPAWRGRVPCRRVRRRADRRPPERGRPDTQLRRRAPGVLRRHARTGRPRRTVRRRERPVAGAGRYPQRGARHGPPARRTRRREAHVPRLLLRHRHRRGLRADVPRPRRSPGAGLPRRPVRRPRSTSCERTRPGSSTRSTSFLADCAEKASCPFHNDGDPSRRADHAQGALRAGPQRQDDQPDHRGEEHAQGRRRRVLHRARSPRCTTSSTAGPRWPRRSPARRRATDRCCSTSPTATTAATTTAPTTTSTRSSGSSSATTGTTRSRAWPTSPPSTTATSSNTRFSAATSAARRSGAIRVCRGRPRVRRWVTCG